MCKMLQEVQNQEKTGSSQGLGDSYVLSYVVLFDHEEEQITTVIQRCMLDDSVKLQVRKEAEISYGILLTSLAHLSR